MYRFGMQYINAFGRPGEPCNETGQDQLNIDCKEIPQMWCARAQARMGACVYVHMCIYARMLMHAHTRACTNGVYHSKYACGAACSCFEQLSFNLEIAEVAEIQTPQGYLREPSVNDPGLYPITQKGSLS